MTEYHNTIMELNYKCLKKLPMMKDLKKKYKSVKKTNEKLIKLLINLYNENNILKNNSIPTIDLTQESDGDNSDIVEENDNISYHFIENKSLTKIKLERQGYIDRCKQPITYENNYLNIDTDESVKNEDIVAHNVKYLNRKKQQEEEEQEEQEVEVEEEEVEYEEVEEDEDEGVYEVIIKNKTYYVSNEVDSIIYATDENGDISEEVGKYVKGKPKFN